MTLRSSARKSGAMYASAHGLYMSILRAKEGATFLIIAPGEQRLLTLTAIERSK